MYFFSHKKKDGFPELHCECKQGSCVSCVELHELCCVELTLSCVHCVSDLLSFAFIREKRPKLCFVTVANCWWTSDNLILFPGDIKSI